MTADTLSDTRRLWEFSRKLDAACSDAALLARVRETAIQWPADLWALWAISRLYRAPYVVEIGTHFGGSMLWLGWCFRPRHMVTVDPWKGMAAPAERSVDEWKASAAMAKDRLGLEPVQLRAEFVDVAGGLPAGGVDLVFIDGYHAEGAVAADLAACWPLVRVGGLVVGHDYGDYRTDGYGDLEGVVRAVNGWEHEPATVLMPPSRIWFCRKGAIG